MDNLTREARLNAAFVKLADTLIAEYDVIDLLDTLMEECIALLDSNAAGLMLANSHGALELVASTSEGADFVEIMQLNAGSGPCIECYTSGKALSVSDIEETAEKWPEFQAAAIAKGFRSVQATPLRLRNQTIGTLNLFSANPTSLSASDAGVAQALADVATIGILQERVIRESGIVAEQLQRALDSRVLIEQAKGVLSEANSIGMDEAFIALRAFARNNNLSLRFVAEGVTNRTLTILGSTQGESVQSTESASSAQ